MQQQQLMIWQARDDLKTQCSGSAVIALHKSKVLSKSDQFSKMTAAAAAAAKFFYSLLLLLLLLLL